MRQRRHEDLERSSSMMDKISRLTTLEVVYFLPATVNGLYCDMESLVNICRPFMLSRD
jgi:hypothetical protein